MTNFTGIYELVNKNLPNSEDQFKLLQVELAKYLECSITFFSREDTLPVDKTKKIGLTVKIPSDKFDEYTKEDFYIDTYVLIRGLALGLVKECKEGKLQVFLPSQMLEKEYLLLYEKEGDLNVTGIVKFIEECRT